MSQEDIHSNLLGQGKKSGQTYTKRITQIQNQIQILRNKNNLIQKQSDNDMDGDIKRQIYEQSKFMEQQIVKIKNMLAKFASDFKDPSSKTRLKQLWRNASKQIQRNKVIMERSVNDAPRQSFIRESKKVKSNITSQNRGSRDSRQYSRNRNNLQQNFNKGQGVVHSQIAQQDIDQSELKLQQTIQRERNQLLTHLQQKNLKINQIMNDMALIVEEQGDQINLITDNINQANDNVNDANQDIDSANAYQRKARKKYCIIAMAMLLLCVALLGIIFILYQRNDN